MDRQTKAPERLVLVFVAALLIVGCGKKEDPVAKAEKKDVATGVAAPSIVEVKSIAEEGFIYGLPIVMNYAVMNDFVIDKNSGQFKAPFNAIDNEHRVFTYQDTTVITPNSDTPYSMMWLDLRAEPMVISVPAVDKKRYYSVMLNDGNTFNYGYIGSRATGSDAGDYLVAGRAGKARHRPASRRRSARPPISRSRFSARSYSMRPTWTM